MQKGLVPSELGIIYLTPNPEKTKDFGDILLKVETGDLKLTCFEDCKEWEVLCWGCIPPENIEALESSGGAAPGVE